METFFEFDKQIRIFHQVKGNKLEYCSTYKKKKKKYFRLWLLYANETFQESFKTKEPKKEKNQ